MVDVFAELYEMENIVVIDAGRYGFVELKYYKLPHGFEEDATFTDSRTLFEELWREWRNTKLYLLAKDTPLSEKGYKGIFPYGRRTGRDKPIKRFRGKSERRSNIVEMSYNWLFYGVIHSVIASYALFHDTGCDS